MIEKSVECIFFKDWPYLFNIADVCYLLSVSLDHQLKYNLCTYLFELYIYEIDKLAHIVIKMNRGKLINVYIAFMYL